MITDTLEHKLIQAGRGIIAERYGATAEAITRKLIAGLMLEIFTESKASDIPPEKLLAAFIDATKIIQEINKIAKEYAEN